MLHIVTALVIFIIPTAYSRTLCSRIFFQNMDEDAIPYKFIIEGVFVKQSQKHKNFPVYKRENDEILFYLSEQSNGKWLAFGFILGGKSFVVRAQTKASAVDWLANGVQNKNDVFGRLISQWEYHDDRDQHYHEVRSLPNIKAVCVDTDFMECSSDQMYLNTNLYYSDKTTANIMNIDYFERIPKKFRYLRPVYQHKRQSNNWYLLYTMDKYWVVTTSTHTTLKSSDSGVVMRVRDYAWKLDFISSVWSKNVANRWTSMPNLKLRCRGVGSQVNICSTNPCLNSGTCLFTVGNETLCVCPSGYIGRQCETSKKCPKPTLSSGEIGFSYPKNTIPGNVAMTFCRTSNPSVRYAICYDGNSNTDWSKQGNACTEVSRTYDRVDNLSPGSSASRVNFDKMPGLSITVLTCAIMLQILLPFTAWICTIFKASRKEKSERQEDQIRQEDFQRQLAVRLDNVESAQNPNELESGVQDCQRDLQEYQQEKEATGVQRKKGMIRNVSLLRILSIDCFISFYLWLIYLGVCSGTQCLRYGYVFSQLFIMAIVMVILSPVLILIESKPCDELSYLRNIMKEDSALGYIQKMQAVAPVISMTVECYHFETRMRTVYYTDAEGNTSSHLETYQEIIITHTESNDFEFGCCVDVSKREMPSLSSVAMTRLKIDAQVLFGDQETEDFFNQKKQEMLERNKDKDEFVEFSSQRSIPGLQERICAYVDLSRKPWWIGHRFFWLATVLQMTWPYR